MQETSTLSDFFFLCGGGSGGGGGGLVSFLSCSVA